MTDTQLVIIGSGPAGYTAAVYAARANLSPVVIAGSVTAGGELMNTTDVENYPGFPAGVQGPELMESMREQAEKFGAEVIYDDVASLKLEPGAHQIETALGARYTAQAVILATGSAYRELNLPNEKKLSGHGVSWCATCDGFFFRDQHIAVIGGGDSALEEATFLTRFASKVTLIHRRQELRASQAMQDRAAADEKLEYLLDSEVAEIHGEDSLTGLTVRNTVTGETSELPVTGMFVAIGSDPRTSLFGDQLSLRPDGYLNVEGRTSKTAIEGVFAAGDVIDSVYRQAITAAGSGCSAALDAEHYLADLEAVAKQAEAVTTEVSEAAAPVAS
ncbi:MAG: thioredoxin-disulfide reductase [Brevibacterium aurantiacum]|uniref:Thioredoxin reductase n=1 Tax=Brevibacterium aurantiacum TaxID=273384 RepID=A0A2A3Z9W0_BREAU|nr:MULTISPECIES: thioredoxin-disulfide reductase [Brevibacterium]MDN5549853.1 thioredoxin-disulfide reductase [Brevibacterium sp.]AZL07431.1 thioredoxin-disulfide reductase [Brevibacterium aurantiacum]AZL11021.1 thioredoxin-disulfide reductase [Brevibacterium aurantiacum]AZL14618.1 thioredoxin-disulfide reductase [Brevibacterium aurantiacum]AZT95185.1 thioredoxin-disulfide reductase [Brevibacterium aurantiacum]